MESLIYDRTLSDITNLTSKGKFNASFLNRVESWTKYLNDKFNELGYQTNAIKPTVSGTLPLRMPDSANKPIDNYRIYGNTGGVGDLVDGKYQIPIKISGKNLLDETAISPVSGALYGYIKLNVQYPYVISITDKDTSVNMSEIFFGVTPNGINANEGVRWLMGNGSQYYSSLKIDSKYGYFSFYPNNQATIDKIRQRYYIQVELGTERTEYEPYTGLSNYYTISLGNPLNKTSNSYFDYENSKLYRADTEKVIIDGKKAYKQEATQDFGTLPLWNENIFWDKLVDGETYTLVFHVKGNTTINAGSNIYINQQSVKLNGGNTVTTEWAKCVARFTFNASKASFICHFYPQLKSGDVIYYADFKLFRGDTEEEVLYTDYIDYNTQSVTRYVNEEPITESVYLPIISTVGNDSVLSVESTVQPSKAEVRYTTNKDGYKERMPYIESTGTQYIDTGIVPNQDTKVELKFKLSSLTGTQLIMGASETYYNSRNIQVSTYQTQETVYRFGNKSVTVTDATILKNYTTLINTVTIDKTGVVYISDNLTKTFNFEDTTDFISDKSLQLFARNANYIATGRIYSCRIWQGETIVRDYIPAKDDNGVACLYDKVTKQYFYNKGTGQFVYGERWQTKDDFTIDEADRIINNINVLRSIIALYNDTPATPETMRFLDYIKSNNIEKILFDIDKLVNNMVANFRYSNDLISGEVGLC